MNNTIKVISDKRRAYLLLNTAPRSYKNNNATCKKYNFVKKRIICIIASKHLKFLQFIH